MTRTILHIDMDAFFASIEQVRNPALKNKPIVIGGTKNDTRSVVATASYQARKYGIHSAMPIAQAKRLCPQAIFIRGDHQHYVNVSKQIRAILETVTPEIEFTSIDEAYLDITQLVKRPGDPGQIAGHCGRSQ